MKKNIYTAPEAEFVCVSTDADILQISNDYGTEFPASFDEAE